MFTRFLSQRCAIIYQFCTKIKPQLKESMDLAITSSKIIKFIANPYQNKKWNIESNSLREEIIKIILHQTQTEYARKQLLPYFNDGVTYNNFVFNQDRIVNGKNVNKNMTERKIIFSPTTLVTSQVFSNALSLQIEKQVFYGLFGTSKTFSFMLYTRLSYIVAQSKFQGIWKDKQKEFESYKVPKMIYLNIDPDKFLAWADIHRFDYLDRKDKLKELKGDVKKKSQEYIGEIILEQCPQLRKLKENFEKQNKNNSQEFNLRQHINKLYKQQGITTVLVVDQINKVASQIRKAQSGYYENKAEFQLAPYYACDYLNNLRIKYMGKNIFDKIIMNSSYNLELYNKQIQQQLQLIQSQQITESLKSLKYLQFFNEEEKKEQVVWELTDMLIFEIQNKLGMLLDQWNIKPSKEVRKQVYDILKDQSKKTFITPLSIRQGIQSYKKKINIMRSPQTNYLQITKNILGQIFTQMIYRSTVAVNNFLRKASNQLEMKFRRSIILGLYSAAIVKLKENNDDSLVEILLDQNEIDNLPDIDIYDRNLVTISSDRSKIQSLLTASNLVRILEKKYILLDQRQYEWIFKFFKQNSIKGQIWENVFLQTINDSVKIKLTFQLNNSKYDFNFTKIFYLEAIPKKQNKKNPTIQDTLQYQQKIDEYFMRVLTEVPKLMEQKKQNALMFIPCKKQYGPIRQKVFSDPKLFQKWCSNAKIFDCLIIKKVEKCYNDEKDTYEIHFIDLSVSEKLNSRVENFSAFYNSFGQNSLKLCIDQMKDSFAVETYYWILTRKMQNEEIKISNTELGQEEKNEQQDTDAQIKISNTELFGQAGVIGAFEFQAISERDSQPMKCFKNIQEQFLIN